MKKVLKYTGIIAAVLAIVSFILVMVGNAIVTKTGMGELTVESTVVIFGKTETVLGHDVVTKAAPTALIAWILTLAAVLILVLGALLPILKVKALDKFAGLLNLCAVVALVVAGVLTFFGVSAFYGANDVSVPSNTTLTANVVIGGILAIVAGVVAILPAAADFVSKKK